MFSHQQNGCRQRLLPLPITAASKPSSCCCSPHVNHERGGRRAVGAGANAWAAAWGCSRERARWQEGTACVQNRHRQRAPLMFFVSLFCNQGMNHALPGAHSLLPPRASQPCLPWGSRAPQNRGGRCFWLRTVAVPPWEWELGHQRGQRCPRRVCCGLMGKAGDPL